MSNFGTGFTGFKTAIDMVTEGLGGSHTRGAVAKIFGDFLNRAIDRRTGARYPSYGGLTWTEATDIDFDQARDAALKMFERPCADRVASADWKGAQLVLCSDTAILEGGGYSVAVASLYSSPDYCRKARDTVTKWRVHIYDDGLRLITGKDSTLVHNGKPTSTNASSAAGARKSLRRIVETFFGVSFK